MSSVTVKVVTLCGTLKVEVLPAKLSVMKLAIVTVVMPVATVLVVLTGVVAVTVLPLTLWLAPPEKNVNWVRGFGHPPRSAVPLPAHFALVMLMYPLAIYLPTHWLLTRDW